MVAPPQDLPFDQKSSENTVNMKPSCLRHFLLLFSKLGGPTSKHITNTCIFRSHLAMVLSAWWTTFKKHRENLIQRNRTNA